MPSHVSPNFFIMSPYALICSMPDSLSAFCQVSPNCLNDSTDDSLSAFCQVSPNCLAPLMPASFMAFCHASPNRLIVSADDSDAAFSMTWLKLRCMSVRMVEGRHLDRCHADARGRGEDLPVAVAVGVHPAFSIAGAYQAEWGASEHAIAGALAGGRLALAACPSTGLLVPAGAEVVMEGRILADRTHREWMVEMLQTYDHAREQPVFELDRLHYRDRAVYHDVLAGYSEHRLLMGMPAESKLDGELRARLGPLVRAVRLTAGGCSWLHAVVQVSKRSDADAAAAIEAAFAAHRSLKQVTVVDEDIDPASAEAVEYAMATRFQADRDLTVLRGVRGSSLDPSSDQERLQTAKLGIDATRPLGKRAEGFEIARIPGADRTSLADYAGAGAGDTAGAGRDAA